MKIDCVTTANAEPCPPPPPETLLQRALQGDRWAERRLVEELAPTIRASIARELIFRRRGRTHAGAQEVEDISQSVFLFLFANGGRALLAWDPERGRAFKSFVGLLAQRCTVTVLRSRRKRPWSEDPSPPEDLDPADETNGPESRAISRDMLATLVEGVRARLNPRGLQLFELLYLDGCPTEDACAATGLAPPAIYQWRRRLRQVVDEVANDLAKSPPPAALAG